MAWVTAKTICCNLYELTARLLCVGGANIYAPSLEEVLEWLIEFVNMCTAST